MTNDASSVDGPDEREALLMDLLSGVRRSDDPEVQRAFAADPSLREEFAALRALAGELEAVAPSVRQEVAQARAEASAGDRRRAEAAIREGLGMPPRRRSVWPYALAAAAAVLVTALAWWLRMPASAPLPDRLHSGERVVVAPLRHDQLAGGFVFKTEPRAGCSYQVRIYGTGSELLLQSDELTGSSWQLDATQVARLSALPVVRWQVWLIDPDQATGENVDSGELRR